jgi:hypothetical protein
VVLGLTSCGVMRLTRCARSFCRLKTSPLRKDIGGRADADEQSRAPFA